MKIFISILLLAVLIISIELLLSWRLIAVGNKLADKAVPFSRDLPNAKTKILIIGDSTGVGTGASSPKLSIAGRVGKTYPQANIVNLSVNGARTSELIPRLKKLKNEHFDLIMLHIGGNDTVRFTDLITLKESIEAVLDLAIAHADNVTLTSTGNVGTAKLLPFATRWAFENRTRKVRAIFKKAAEDRKVSYVDLFREKDLDPFAKDPKKYYAMDSFHPSDIGYEDWYSFIEKVLPTLNIQ